MERISDQSAQHRNNLAVAAGAALQGLASAFFGDDTSPSQNAFLTELAVLFIMRGRLCAFETETCSPRRRGVYPGLPLRCWRESRDKKTSRAPNVRVEISCWGVS